MYVITQKRKLLGALIVTTITILSFDIDALRVLIFPQVFSRNSEARPVIMLLNAVLDVAGRNYIMLPVSKRVLEIK